MKKFINPTEDQIKIVSALLQKPFPGVKELTEQVNGMKCKAVESENEDEYSFMVQSLGPVSEVAERVPVEAYGKDKDGMDIVFLLHVVGGLIDEVEIYRADGQPIISLPLPETLVVKAAGSN